MKKIIVVFCTLFFLISISSPIRVSAGTVDAVPYVKDLAMLLTEEECSSLEQEARQISEQYQCGIYIVTVKDFKQYSDSGDVYETAKSIYKEFNLGWGEEKSGILLLMSTENRDYTLIAFGYGNTAFTDYGKKKVEKEFLNNFRNEDWYGGLEDYLSKSSYMLDYARAGHPIDVNSTFPLRRIMGYLLSIVCGCLCAFMACALTDMTMKSVAKKKEANKYLNLDQAVVSVRESQFSHTTQTSEMIEIHLTSLKGGTTVDKDGFSGTRGKY